MMPCEERVNSSPAWLTPSWLRSRQRRRLAKRASRLSTLPSPLVSSWASAAKPSAATPPALSGVAIAEEFAAVVDAAVAVAIEDEEGVVALDPTGGGPDTVAVVVEEDGVAGVDADGFEAVVVEVEDERVNAERGGALGGEEGGVSGRGYVSIA
jgi:hypothetical protein